MPISEALRDLSHDRAFWTGYLDAAEPDPPPDRSGLRVGLPVAGGYGLVLDLDLSSGEHTLGLRQPAASEPVHLGGTGPGRPWVPALTWPELDLIGRVTALDDPTLPHPGLPVALLSRFAGPVGGRSDVATLLAAALRSLRRTVEPVQPVRPEQAPLPLFTDDRWWPQPVQPSPRVLTDEQVAGYVALATRRAHAPTGPRAGTRFPAAGLAELIRQARGRLDRLRGSDWYRPATVLPLARRIAVTGDLGLVPRLAAVLAAGGCDHPTVLDALTGPVVPAEACWMVETLAAVEPGALLGHPGAPGPAADGG